MEDILAVYQRTYSEDEVLVCMDETSKQHVKETRPPLSPRAGSSEKYDYEYERNGVSNLFMLSAPLEGWRHVKVTDRHTKQDWAQLIKELVDDHFPKKKIILVMDNLNTHKLGSLYATFEPEEARRISERLEIHYTPKHGSWLDMAEIEIRRAKPAVFKPKNSRSRKLAFGNSVMGRITKSRGYLCKLAFYN